MLWPERIKFSCNQVLLKIKDPSTTVIMDAVFLIGVFLMKLFHSDWVLKIIWSFKWCQFILNITTNIINIISILSFAGCLYHSTLGWASIRDVQSGLVKPEQVKSSLKKNKKKKEKEYLSCQMFNQIVCWASPLSYTVANGFRKQLICSNWKFLL